MEQPPKPVPQVLHSVTHNGVTLHSCHPVLKDFARDLSKCISRPLTQDVDVFVGVHVIRQPPETGRIRIGIQTEQMRDRNGNLMWKAPKRRQRRFFAESYDALLDLSPDNASAYKFLPEELRRKLHFGPHIFPDSAVAHAFRDAPPLFVGSLNDRRRSILDQLKEEMVVEVAPRGTFGRALDRMLAAHGSVLNIHFQEGEYSEYPRFLKAYLAGKPFISEMLSPPLIADRHYIGLKDKLTIEIAASLFERLQGLASEYSFRDFLERAIHSKRHDAVS